MIGEYRSHESQQLPPAFRLNLGQGFVDDAGNVLSQATVLASSRSWQKSEHRCKTDRRLPGHEWPVRELLVVVFFRKPEYLLPQLRDAAAHGVILLQIPGRVTALEIYEVASNILRIAEGESF